MSHQFRKAFEAAYGTTYEPLTQKDLVIIDQVSEIRERINAIEGFKADISYSFSHNDHVNFTFEVSFDNLKTSFELKANKGEFLKSIPKYFVNRDFFVEEEVHFDTDANIEKFLLRLCSLLGEKAAKNKMKEDLSDALARQRLMKTMPMLVGKPSPTI